MSSLETTILDLKFPNPFILASGPTTANAERVINAFRAGWGGAVLETITLNLPISIETKEHEIRSGRVKWGRIGALPISQLSLEEWCADIEKIQSNFPKRPLIASITAEDSLTAWQELASRLSTSGIDGFEINANYPSFAVEDERMAELGQGSQVLARVIRWVREATPLPLFVKLSPNVTDILPVARTALEAGADAFTAIGGLRGIGSVDLTDFATLPPMNAHNMAGTYTGPGLKPVALRWTAVLAKSLEAPLLGSGGVSTWQDAIEFFSVGASAVQVGTAVDWYGIDIIDQFKQGLERYLEDHMYSNPAEIRGKALPHIVGFDELDLEYKFVAILEESECIGCDLCARVCNDGGFQAISMVDNIAKVDPSKCDGCGLCIYVCPPDIMSLVPVEMHNTIA
jgi:dihydropyrimidine dehydrogenase (NAD+) subunit PreA